MRNLLFFKVYLLCLFCSYMGTVSACSAGETEQTNMLLLGGISDGDGLMYYYFTEWNRFPMKASWCPGNEAFPLDLWRQGERLRPLVEAPKGIKDKMSLWMVEIRRINPPQWGLKAHGLTVQDFANQWFVAFDWVVESPPTSDGKFATNEHAVMLLDRTLPIKKLAPHQDGEVRNTTNLVTHVASNQSNTLTPDLKLLDQMLDERRKLLSRMNLGACSAAAAKYVSEHVGNSRDLELTEIWLRFAPVKPLASESMRELANNVDWIATFIFAERPTLSTWYEVDTVFDGTILANRTRSQ
jgi:hypothetical protein